MSNEIIKYHNDLNSINFPNFTEQEQNLLFCMIDKIRKITIQRKNNGELSNDFIEFSYDELIKFCSKNYTRKELFDIVDLLKNRFFNANIPQVLETRTEIGKRFIKLFKDMTIYGIKNNHDNIYEKPNLTRVTMSINPEAAYILDEVLEHFTEFEKAEFISLSGKYTKTLYRLLKQFRTKGYFYEFKNKWNDFLKIMNIPPNYTMCDIDKRVLKPAIKELMTERNLFDQERIPFQNLTYTKIKGKGRGRGGSVVGIEFNFKAEPKKNIKKILNTDEERFYQNWHAIQSYKWRSSAKRLNELGEFKIGSIDRNALQNNEGYKILVQFWGIENNKYAALYFRDTKHLKDAINSFQRIDD